MVQGSTDAGVGVGYNSKTLNPDYGLPQDAQNETLYGDEEYYVENHDDAYMDKAVDEYLRNNSTARRYSTPSYGRNFDDVFYSDPLYYQGTIFDPLYRSYYGVYSPFAYNPYYRPYSSFYRPWGPRVSVNLAFGFGSGWGSYYDPFYYGGGFGYGYGYGSPYSRYGYGYGSAWCPPSYYGGYNNTVVINNIENSNPGNVRYGTRQPRGGSYIVNNAPRERSTSATAANTRTIRSRADNSVRRATERTVNNDRVIQNRSQNMRTRSVNQYDQSDRTSSRFRTHSLDSRSSTNNVIDRRSNSSVQQRSRSIGNDTYRTPTRDLRTRRSQDRIRSSSSSPSRVSGSRFSNPPSRSPASSGVRSRSNYSRSSSPSRVRSSSSNYGRSSSGSRVSTPSRSRSSASSPSRVRSSSPSPNRSSSMPSRGSSSGTRSIRK